MSLISGVRLIVVLLALVASAAQAREMAKLSSVRNSSHSTRRACEEVWRRGTLMRVRGNLVKDGCPYHHR